MEQKCYSKQELALEYFPDASPEVASAHLRRWINRCKPLHDVLVKSGYTKWSKVMISSRRFRNSGENCLLRLFCIMLRAYSLSFSSSRLP